jgi:hypothetical protein
MWLRIKICWLVALDRSRDETQAEGILSHAEPRHMQIYAPAHTQRTTCRCRAMHAPRQDLGLNFLLGVVAPSVIILWILTMKRKKGQTIEGGRGPTLRCADEGTVSSTSCSSGSGKALFFLTQRWRLSRDGNLPSRPALDAKLPARGAGTGSFLSSSPLPIPPSIPTNPNF